MNVLLVFPLYPDTFWSFKHALKFVSKKASFPPLGLITVASMMPAEWNKKLVDMNVEQLHERDLFWADYVCISAMSVQRASAEVVIARCNALHKKVIAGGPMFTSSHEDFPGVDHFVLNEAEVTLAGFISDLEAGTPKRVYTSGEWADLSTTPLPAWELVSMKRYTSMNLQYSRGCPYDCDFCDITVLYGKRPRTKSREQVLAELDRLYASEWRGPVFFVDDNFIGNKTKLKKEILPAIVEWMEQRNHPFYLTTEASINLSDDEELLALMARAGFEAVFVGIETPNEASLEECNKKQNRHRDLVASVKRIQSFGMEVQGGFILGFDSDHPGIFEELASFIQECGIVTAMVGLLNAPKGTTLYSRLLKEGRLLEDFSGNNTDLSMNFIPHMHRDVLVSGYRDTMRHLYEPRVFYHRVMRFIRTFEMQKKKVFHMNAGYVRALFKSMFLLGVVGRERLYYWKLFAWSLFRRPQLFSMAITFSIYGYHFRKVFEQY
jgi:radical SAM superfamily enzyme YgiQ (UPF0313 family)